MFNSGCWTDLFLVPNAIEDLYDKTEGIFIVYRPFDLKLFEYSFS